MAGRLPRAVTRTLAVVGMLSAPQDAHAQTAADSVAVLRPALDLALQHARFQAAHTDTLVAFPRAEPALNGFPLLARLADTRPELVVRDTPPLCGWSGDRASRAMGVQVSRPQLDRNSATFILELLCVERLPSGPTFAWTFRYSLLRTPRGWVIRELTELSIT